ncbi:hypothetical protein DAI22_08g029600 [Oryza sativa Japonica Group]|nr:hypothetical protein DAI22_08g029600 [Oryza sativa Japonica Group]
MLHDKPSTNVPVEGQEKASVQVEHLTGRRSGGAGGGSRRRRSSRGSPAAAPATAAGDASRRREGLERGRVGSAAAEDEPPAGSTPHLLLLPAGALARSTPSSSTLRTPPPPLVRGRRRRCNRGRRHRLEASATEATTPAEGEEEPAPVGRSGFGGRRGFGDLGEEEPVEGGGNLWAPPADICGSHQWCLHCEVRVFKALLSYVSSHGNSRWVLAL